MEIFSRFLSPVLIFSSLLFPLLIFFLRRIIHTISSSSSSSSSSKKSPTISFSQLVKNGDRYLEWTAECILESPTNTILLPLCRHHRKGGNHKNIKHVLKDNFDNYPKGPQQTSTLNDLLSHNIFNADGDNWRLRPKTANLEFNTKTICTFILANVNLGRPTPWRELRLRPDSDFSVEFLCDIVVSFVLAGRDMTSTALAWFFWLISMWPVVEQRILAKVDVVRVCHGNWDEMLALEELWEMDVRFRNQNH